MSYTKYIESKILSQSCSFHVHSYDLIKCYSDCARWLRIIQLFNPSLPKVVCNHILLIVCFSMIVWGGGGCRKRKIIYIFFPPYMEHPQPYIITKNSIMVELLCSYITFHDHFYKKISYAIHAGFALCDCQFSTNNLMSSNSYNA